MASTVFFDAVADLVAASVASTVSTILLNGYYATGDDGGGTYIRSSSAGPRPGLVQSADGQWWALANLPMNVRQFGAKGDGSTDDSAALQDALDAAQARNGAVVIPEGEFVTSQTLVSYSVSITGAGKGVSRIVKNTANTKVVTIYAGALVVYNNGSLLPWSMNAVLVLTGPSGRWTGELSGVSYESTLSNSSDHESQQAEFGIVSVGSISSSSIADNEVLNAQYGMIFPSILAGAIVRNDVNSCLYGVGVDEATSHTISNNYANNCRSYGYFLRSVNYSLIAANACDFLNRNDWYPDRTIECFGYRLNSMVGCKVISNGQEVTLGTNWFLETLTNCVVSNNESGALGSDFVGSGEIAWLKSDGVLRGCDIQGNVSRGYNLNGLLFNGASATQHHNIYLSSLSNVQQNGICGNIVRATVSGAPVEAGWLNNYFGSSSVTLPNAATAGSVVSTFAPTLTALTLGNLSIAYGANNRHYSQEVGGFYHVWGCFDFTPTYTTAAGALLFTGFVGNGASLWRLNVAGAESSATLSKHPVSMRLNASSNQGAFFDNNDALVAITDIPNGTSVQMFYEGTFPTF